MTPASTPGTAGGRSQVGYVFGACNAEAMPGPALIALLGDLGINEAASRTALSRMTKAGQLAADRRGRIAPYRLQGAYREQFLRFRQADVRTAWDGSFAMIIYDVPETLRSERDTLRDRAAAAGFAQLRPGVLIGLSDPAGWCTPWQQREDLWVRTGRLDCDPETAAELAARAWKLADRLDDQRALLDRWQRILRQVRSRQPSPRRAFQLFNELMHGYAGQHLTLPALPDELAPPGWPGRRIGELLGELTHLLGPGVSAHARQVAEECGVADLIEELS